MAITESSRRDIARLRRAGTLSGEGIAPASFDEITHALILASLATVHSTSRRWRRRTTCAAAAQSEPVGGSPAPRAISRTSLAAEENRPGSSAARTHRGRCPFGGHRKSGHIEFLRDCLQAMPRIPTRSQVMARSAIRRPHLRRRPGADRTRHGLARGRHRSGAGWRQRDVSKKDPPRAAQYGPAAAVQRGDEAYVLSGTSRFEVAKADYTAVMRSGTGRRSLRPAKYYGLAQKPASYRKA